MKFEKCLKCGKKVSKNCHLGYCNKCRDRSGKKNPFYGKKHDIEMIEKTKKKLSIISKNKWKDKKYREKVIKGTSKPRQEKFKKEQSIRITKWYQDNPKQGLIRSKKMKESWENGKIKPNINSINESKMEREIRNKIIELLPNRNVRKSTIRINKKWYYPDIRIDKKIIIEFFGDYWHANPQKYKENDIIHHKLTAKQIWDNDKKRIKTLEDNGFKIFIIWENIYILNKKRTLTKLINNTAIRE